MSDMVLRVAAKGVVINQDGNVLILREANTYDEGTQIGKWGLPGGRLAIGESYQEGLRREVGEETGLQVKSLYPVYVGEWRPVIKGIPHQIIAIFTACQAKSSDLVLSEEHDKFAWVNMKTLAKYNMMAPDDEVIKAYYARH